MSVLISLLDLTVSYFSRDKEYILYRVTHSILSLLPTLFFFFYRDRDVDGAAFCFFIIIYHLVICLNCYVSI